MDARIEGGTVSGLALRTDPFSDAERQAAKERLRAILPHLFLAANAALIETADGQLQIGILAREKDGGGRITASFEAEAFLRDLETLVGPVLVLDDDDGDDDDDDDGRETR